MSTFFKIFKMLFLLNFKKTEDTGNNQKTKKYFSV